jgi:hypothetical protein
LQPLVPPPDSATLILTTGVLWSGPCLCETAMAPGRMSATDDARVPRVVAPPLCHGLRSLHRSASPSLQPLCHHQHRSNNRRFLRWSNGVASGNCCFPFFFVYCLPHFSFFFRMHKHTSSTCDRITSENEGFVTLRSIKGFLTKRECTNTHIKHNDTISEVMV